MTQDFVVKPFFDRVPKIKWLTFEKFPCGENARSSWRSSNTSSNQRINWGFSQSTFFLRTVHIFFVVCVYKPEGSVIEKENKYSTDVLLYHA